MTTQEPTSQQIEYRDPQTLIPYQRNARTHSNKQIKQISQSIERFGFTNPVLISDTGEIIAGHGRALAAQHLHMSQIPTLRLSHLNAAERRAYVLADNKLAEQAGWDQDILVIELQALIDLDFEAELTGFSLAEIDFVLGEAQGATQQSAQADLVPAPLSQPPITQRGDIWQMGEHRLLCGDARSRADMERLMDNEKADLIFTDPPYNVKIAGNVCGSGKIKHEEFAMASGEMSEAAFTEFLHTTLGNAAGCALRMGRLLLSVWTGGIWANC